MNNSKSHISLDLSKSHGSFAWCSNKQAPILDLHGHFSSLPLGYNHPIFQTEEFKNEIIEAAGCKISTCEYDSKYGSEFLSELNHIFLPYYDFYHLACTGALAVEWACKAAIDITGKKKIISFSNGFHGVSSYGNFLTHCADDRLEGFPDILWEYVDDIEGLEYLLETDNKIAAVIFEPINCTAGDINPGQKFNDAIINLCKKYDVLSIADEIQTGLSTGKVFMTNFQPDITVFGKKFQVSGFATRRGLGQQLNPSKYCITFDGDTLDMIRSKFILRHIRSESLLERSIDIENLFKSVLSDISWVKNVRGHGLILAFDLETEKTRNELWAYLLEKGILVNIAGPKTIRLRPGFCIKNEEIELLAEEIKRFV